MTRFAARAATLFALLSTVALAAGAQDAGKMPKRPKPERDAELRDENDWRAYFECGQTAKHLDRAYDCFYWATRLDPARPEPRYAQWWLSDGKDTSAHRAALYIDPFMYQGRVLFIEARPAGMWVNNQRKAWDALRAGRYFEASNTFAKYVASKPNDLDARWGFAIAYYYRSLFDSSAAQLRRLEERLRREQKERLLNVYRSTEFVNYMEAAAMVAGGRRDSARASLERALTENLAFYPAHMQLADLDLDAGDTAAAAQHWAQARELYGADVVARRRYALFLLRTGHAAEAETELRAVLAAEPYWVDAHADLAAAI
ncbi:MAG TPA: hypothetical protein VFJ74_01155, partial [Gemmatimonadaceae bacterium]|nr:hypothetical protein [Gemmatimonadaceae bacterium]